MSDLDFVKFVARLGFAVGDGADLDTDPDIIWCDGGIVRLTPLVTTAKVTGSATPWLAAFGPLDLPLDANGYATWNGNEYVMLDDLGDNKTNPSVSTGNATHRVDFLNITAGGTSVKFPTQNVRISADTATDPAHPGVPMLPVDGGVCDLAVLSPVPATGATPITQGRPGLGIVSIAVNTSNLVTTMTDNSTLTAPVEAAFSTGLSTAVSDAQSSASAAATSETNAANSATAASDSATAAATSEANAQAAASTATDAFKAHMRGAWDATVAYALDDLATDQGSTWRRIVAGTTAGHPSTDATNWAVFAAKGVDGTGSVSTVANVAPDGSGNVPLTVSGVAADGAGNFPVTAANVHARPDTWTPTAADVGALPSSGVVPDANLPTRLTDASLSAAYVAQSKVGAANGVPSLDGGGKVPASQLPASLLEYVGSWNAATNTPTLSDATGSQGNVYIVSTAGTQNLGSGSITAAVFDWLLHDGTKWDLVHGGADVVQSVAGLAGAITAAALKVALGAGSASGLATLDASGKLTAAQAPASSSTPLARVIYNPAASVGSSNAGITWADVDATNLAITAIVPVSGTVRIVLEGVANVVASQTVVYLWGVREGAAFVAGSGRRIALNPTAAALQERVRTEIVLSGLTPGSHTFKWAHGASVSNGGGVYIGGSDATPGTSLYGPAIMEVYAE